MAAEPRPIVLDTSYLVALANDRDTHHGASAELHAALVSDEWSPLLVHEYVFLETVTVLLARRGHPIAMRAGENLLESRETQIVLASDTFTDTWETFRGSASWKLSFADAALVALAKRHPGCAIATFDERLAAATGVQVLPR